MTASPAFMIGLLVACVVVNALQWLVLTRRHRCSVAKLRARHVRWRKDFQLRLACYREEILQLQRARDSRDLAASAASDDPKGISPLVEVAQDPYVAALLELVVQPAGGDSAESAPAVPTPRRDIAPCAPVQAGVSSRRRRDVWEYVRTTRVQ